MRFKNWIMFVAVSAGLTGCASLQETMTLPTVGPDTPGNSFMNVGQLMVYSATISGDSRLIWHHPHTSYTIYDADGQKLRLVMNHVGIDDPVPSLETLHAGQYAVVAQSDVYGKVRVPVAIQGGRLTRVFLERGGMPKSDRENRTNFVTFPNGDVIGIRADLKK
ncbi:MAG: hypothetical protein WCO56_19210 [Verrucomicrobiota bacterium]